MAALFATYSLTGCSVERMPVIAAVGEVATTQRDLLFIAFGLMLVVLVPVWAMTGWFAWKYRVGSQGADYRPEWASAPRVEAALWLVPAALVAILGTLLWIYTHRLDPYRPVAGSAPTLVVQAVALDWKWVFIYPAEGVATVNELVVPAGRAVEVRVTSDTAMNSLFIPGLAGQIYAMAGMETRLSFMADVPRSLSGRNMQYSGAGFPEQTFAALVVDPAGYDEWTATLRASPLALSRPTYDALDARRAASGVVRYASVEPGLFEAILRKHAGATPGHGAAR